jgi:hypothetical protein
MIGTTSFATRREFLSSLMTAAALSKDMLGQLARLNFVDDAPQKPPEGTLEFASSDTALVEGFRWAKAQALAYRRDSPAIGPWYEAALPGRNAFCMRESSFALGYARSTENVTITNCYVTGACVLGTMLDGTFKRWPADFKVAPTGRIKCGTESNGGFKNISISNCVFDGCRGFALESVDGALLEDITFTGVTMRDCTNTPLFLRLASRMRGPAGVPVGTLRRIIISNVVSYNSASQFGGAGLISGIPSHPIEDIKIDGLYMEHRGGGTPEMVARVVPQMEQGYPEPYRFGDIPASGFFIRNVNNIELTNVELSWSQQDARPVFYLDNVKGAEFFRIKTPKAVSSPLFALKEVEDFSVSLSRNVKDIHLEKVAQRTISN